MDPTASLVEGGRGGGIVTARRGAPTWVPHAGSAACSPDGNLLSPDSRLVIGMDPERDITSLGLTRKVMLRLRPPCTSRRSKSQKKKNSVMIGNYGGGRLDSMPGSLEDCGVEQLTTPLLD